MSDAPRPAEGPFFRRAFRILIAVFLFTLTGGLAVSCGDGGGRIENQVVMSLGKKITSLDPALAADSPSQTLCAAFYDTLVQYRYAQGEYSLEPGMLAAMPEPSPDGKTFRCRLRGDLYFQDAPPFHGQDRSARKVTARDVVFSLLRLADARLNSPGYWVVRGTLDGIEKFRARTAEFAPGDLTPYDEGCAGLRVLDEQTFEIVCAKANPRLFHLLALPYCAVVSRRAREFYGPEQFAEHPCGSGAFRLHEWKRDYCIVMDRYDEFREEYYSDAEGDGEQKKRLPLADRITCYLVRQNVSSWLMFLQGELDYYALDGDQFQAVADDRMRLAPALVKRGIELLRAPQLETNYIGFHFDDPKLGKNTDLRRAVSLALDKRLRVLHSGGRLTEAYGPVPPGIPGSLENEKGPYGEKDLVRARELLARAGYPGGIDPETGKALVLSFDQTGSDTVFQQLAELMANDLSAIGIELKSNLNTRPRFQAKLASGDMQLFRYSWVADYPDAENFLQLFYSPNAGGCNRANYRDPEYDRMYREIEFMPDSPERTEKYRAMSRYLQERCPWIFESHTMAFVVKHSWLHNYRLHDFAFNRWKYLSANDEERRNKRRSFTPLSMSELR